MNTIRAVIFPFAFVLGAPLTPGAPENRADIAVEVALGAVRRGDAVAAEAAITESVRLSKGSFEWRVRSAHLLYGIADRVKGEASPGVVEALANRALEMIADATRSSGLEQTGLAAAWELAGAVNENIKGDFVTAQGCYQNALAADPSRTTAAAKLKRLSAALASANAKAKGRS